MKKLLAMLSVLAGILSGCEKETGFGLEIYLLKDYKAYENLSQVIIRGEMIFNATQRVC